MNTADIARRLDNLIRLGTIAEVDVAAARVRVATGQLLTGWLPWLALRAGTTRHWSAPTVDEQVILFSPSGELTQGVAIVGLYSDANPANGNSADVQRTTYPDGAVIEYDHVTHQLQATLPEGGVTKLVSTGGIYIDGPIIHQGDYTQTGNQNVTGKVTVSEDVVAAGVSLVKHPHDGVMSGPSVTGAPIPEGA